MKKVLISMMVGLTMLGSIAASAETPNYYNNKWYYSAKLGYVYYIDNQMVKGSVKIGDKDYHFDLDGRITKGWGTEGEYKIYTNNEGIIKFNWQLIGGKWYFFSPLGYMEHDCVISGKYQLGSDGALVE